MFNFGRKKSFLEKCSDSVLGGLAAVGDVVVATGEVIGDAVDAITTPSQKRETVIIHERPVVVERRTTVVTTNSWAECEARRLRQETMRLREENLRMERELADRRRREAERETIHVALDDMISTNYGITYRVKLLIKGDAYKVVVKNCDLGITVFDETFYTAARAYNEFSRRKDILRNR